MPKEWATQFTQDALGNVDAFIAEHAGYSRQGTEQPQQGATNRVIFARRGDDRVVFKVFCEAERKERECFAIRHWAQTRLVPMMICDVDSTMIVMSYVPGVSLGGARETESETAWCEECRDTGRSIGSLTRVPLSHADQTAFESHFYSKTSTLEMYLGRILDLGRSINGRDPAFRGGFWRENLDFIESELPGILSQRRVLYHQDVANLHVWHGRFMGFFDLEMCRVGCAAMQLGSSLGLFDESETAGWTSFYEGWEDATGCPLGPKDRRMAAAASHLLSWRVISRYLSYDGTPGTGFCWASPADPLEYRQAIEALENRLEIER